MGPLMPRLNTPLADTWTSRNYTAHRSVNSRARYNFQERFIKDLWNYLCTTTNRPPVVHLDQVENHWCKDNNNNFVKDQIIIKANRHWGVARSSRARFSVRFIASRSCRAEPCTSAELPDALRCTAWWETTLRVFGAILMLSCNKVASVVRKTKNCFLYATKQTTLLSDALLFDKSDLVNYSEQRSRCARCIRSSVPPATPLLPPCYKKLQ